MKVIINTSRILVGCLFIFSGLVKAIDPLGLAYKMQEFFEVWAADGYMKGMMMWLHEHALLFSIIMITMEVVLGVSLLLGIAKKITAWLLLLLMLLFTFLTSYVLFSGKIRACGCFGDCIPLTPIQTFAKDIILLLLVVLILFGQKYIRPLFSRLVSGTIFVLSLFAVIFLQWYVLRHLPVKDCLPYKAGNDLFKLRQMPSDAVMDKYEYSFIYEKDGVKKEFTKDLPDSTWKYADRKQTLIQKGSNNVPLINDFSFTTRSGNDTTTEILTQPGEYYLLFIKTFEDFPENWNKDIALVDAAQKKGKPIYIVTAQPAKVIDRYKDAEISAMPAIFTCDVTAIKTAARANPAVFLMKGPVVQKKWSWVDFGEVIK
jgi:uncharacterized membrane protein YphA (DoxX/SURF4 family)